MTDTVHNVVLESRAKAVISGVTDVSHFDEQSVCMTTQMGGLHIKGTGLHINQLSIDGGDLIVEGQIDSLEYTKTKKRNESFLARVFK